MKKSSLWRMTALILTLVMLLSTFGLGQVLAETAPLTPEEQVARNNYHSIYMTGIGNARELGGYVTEDGSTVKVGKLLRTAKLADATDEDLARLSGFYQVKKVIDFRSGSERRRDPDREVPGAESLQFNPLPLGFPLFEVASIADITAVLRAIPGGIMDTFMVNQYHVLVSDPFAVKAYKDFFQALLDADGDTVLWHCTAGKDRTGIAAYLLLCALGVDEEVAYADYLLTNYYNADAMQEAYDKVYKIIHSDRLAHEFYIYNGVDASWIQSAINTMNRYYGGVDNYLKNKLGVDDAELQELRTNYLDPAAAEVPAEDAA
ncbi:MAG: tyrosine-protein phosphatase [Clostridia bacterium]|nr:tyrosine-protein phosphatase [Clostridia bacterium]